MTSRILVVPSRIGNVQFIYDEVACAGAIWSVLWNGIEFANRGDDGRLYQTALTTDDFEEDYNPTEGGSLKTPGFGTPSDSQCIEYEQGPNWLRTLTRMALWKTGELSDFTLSKRITIAENVATFDLKVLTSATLRRLKQDKLEILTGYMPDAFSKFYTLDRTHGLVRPLPDGVPIYDGSGIYMGTGGEQPAPIIMSKPDGSAAMAVIVPSWGDAAPQGCGFGRWRFVPSIGCVKWNAVHRIPTPALGATHAEQVKIAWGQLGDAAFSLCRPEGVRAGQIRRLYHGILDRAPDDGGMQYYMDRLAQGEPLSTIATGFANSPEFQSKYGTLTDDAFVNMLYRNILGRAPESQAAVDSHVAVIRQYGRAVDATNFCESREHQTRRLMLDA